MGLQKDASSIWETSSPKSAGSLTSRDGTSSYKMYEGILLIPGGYFYHFWGWGGGLLG